MSTDIKPIKIWGKIGPNPPKIAILVKELGLPHEIEPIALSDVKTPEYIAINPNGRVPAIQDPNTGITLWESGAIILYLIERYDTEHKLSFVPGSTESYLAWQWLFFQVSGQGPYYGQLAWFKNYHPEKLPSAVERYTKEANRVTGVLESHLAKQKVEPGSDGPWLVGGKLSYADLAFITYQNVLTKALGKEDYNEDNYPHVSVWIKNLRARKSVAEVLEAQHGPPK